MTVLIDERPDGVHLSCDEMTSLRRDDEPAKRDDEPARAIRQSGRPETARGLDAKVEKLLTEVAS